MQMYLLYVRVWIQFNFLLLTRIALILGIWWQRHACAYGRYENDRIELLPQIQS